MRPEPADQPWERLYRYWLSKHVGNRPSSRADIDPILEMPPLVANQFMLSVTPSGYFYRLYGSELVHQYRTDLTGKPFGASGFKSPAMDRCRAILDAVASGQGPRVMVVRTPGFRATRCVMVILPLVTPDGRVERILGGMFFGGTVPSGVPILGMLPIEVEIGV